MTKNYIIDGDPLSMRELLSTHPFLGSRVTYSWRILSRYFSEILFDDFSRRQVQNYLYTFGNIQLKEVDE